MEGALISIIIPVFNVEPYLQQCVESVLSQTYRNLEVLLIDDGSTDGSAALCDQWAERDNRVRVVHENNRGLSEARNTALNLIRGTHVMMVDGDDWLPHNAVLHLLQTLTDTGADVAVGSWLMVPDGVTPQQPASTESTEVVMYNRDEAIDEVFYQGTLTNSSCSRLFKAEVFNGLRYEPGLLYEDLAIAYDLLQRITRVAYTTQLVYYYRQRKGSITSNFTPGRLDVLNIMESLEQRVADEAPQHLPAVRSRLLSAYFNMLRLVPHSTTWGRQAADRCWKGIKRLRHGCLADAKVRTKNKIGIIVSLLGKNVFLALFGGKKREKES
ncbi:MAG: glycosyltransferase family 2 protein [Muribaculaceae bacterium]|nr:glycosyltransferase family 2 protein [Muribaculaceae bacterium]